jgi:hypothetical protein
MPQVDNNNNNNNYNNLDNLPQFSFALLIETTVLNMGVRRLFSRGGQKFSRTYFLPKNNEKDTIFPQKRIKTYYF